MINECRVFVGISEGKRSHGKFRRRWEADFKMHVGETGWESVDGIRLTPGRNR